MAFDVLSNISDVLLLIHSFAMSEFESIASRDRCNARSAVVRVELLERYIRLNK